MVKSIDSNLVLVLLIFNNNLTHNIVDNILVQLLSNKNQYLIIKLT